MNTSYFWSLLYRCYPAFRYIPEVTAFLTGALMLCADEDKKNFPTTNFPISHPHCDMLVIGEARSGCEADPSQVFQLWSADVDSQPEDLKFKVFAVTELIRATRRYVELYSMQSAAFIHSIFTPFHDAVSKLPVSNYPPELTRMVKDLHNYLQEKLNSNR